VFPVTYVRRSRAARRARTELDEGLLDAL